MLRSGSRYREITGPDYTDDAFNTARERLINDVVNYAGRDWRAIIVFDGGRNEFSTGEAESVGGVRIMFSPAGQSADKVIEKLAHDARERQVETLVVTSDATIQDTVFGFGVDRMSANGFSLEVDRYYDDARLDETPKVAEKNTVASRIDPPPWRSSRPCATPPGRGSRTPSPGLMRCRGRRSGRRPLAMTNVMGFGVLRRKIPFHTGRQTGGCVKWLPEMLVQPGALPHTGGRERGTHDANAEKGIVHERRNRPTPSRDEAREGLQPGRSWPRGWGCRARPCRSGSAPSRRPTRATSSRSPTCTASRSTSSCAWRRTSPTT